MSRNRKMPDELGAPVTRGGIGRRPALSGAVIGAVLGGILNLIAINTGIALDAAKADGYPLWSWYQVLFILPGAAMAALVGAFAGWGISALATRRSDNRGRGDSR